ncbi:hypothetical protein F220043C3_39380 [Enterocloster asparagiformis]|uniref:hypothetical protein n=1 Tax=Enterocloster asparagiformis TaxID=333367 RepID=UPI0034AE0BCE
MTYPITEERFIAKWLGAIDDPDDADKEFAVALVSALNNAYHAGLEAGKKEAVTCRE